MAGEQSRIRSAAARRIAVIRFVSPRTFCTGPRRAAIGGTTVLAGDRFRRIVLYRTSAWTKLTGAAAMSPKLTARLAGACEMLEGATSAYGQMAILGQLVTFDNAAMTAANILSHASMVWFGAALSVTGVLFHIGWAFLMYQLLTPVNRPLATLAGFVIVVGCAVQAITAVLYVAPLLILQAGGSLGGFTTPQLQDLALVFVHLNHAAFDTYLAFFGLWCVLTGILIFKSTFLPRVLGVFITMSGLGWMLFLLPPLAHHLFPFIAGASAIGELPLQLWLVIMGVNAQRWYEQASMSPSSAIISYRR